MTARRRSVRRKLWIHRRELPLLAEAIGGLAIASLILKLQPFVRIARRMTRPPGPVAAARPDLLSRRVRWAVLAAARRLPWRTVCFDHAIAAQQMLRRRGIAADIVYGVRQSEQGLDAHVWVRLADGWIVVGGEQAALYRPIALFRSGRDEVTVPPAG